ncbi:MAG: ABC transporter ATP-binding protein [Gordonia sp.]|nr:ABC transporter ATP-binding protein [Gordonia sp. (in: high G+C Gram-positive bacteria)]
MSENISPTTDHQPAIGTTALTLEQSAVPADGQSAALHCRNLTAGHGTVEVIRDLDLTARPGKVLTILGPNGSGKTTLLETMAGLLPSLGGEVVLGDIVLPRGNPAKANRSGVVLVPDSRALFTTLTVKENLEIARVKTGPTVAEMLELFPSLARRLKINAGALSGGEQQMLAIARALVQRPTVLLIDEMSMGLAPAIVKQLLPVVRTVASSTGAAVVLVEQHVTLALNVADDAIVLVHGHVVLQGPAADLATNHEALRQAYLGNTPNAA